MSDGLSTAATSSVRHRLARNALCGQTRDPIAACRANVQQPRDLSRLHPCGDKAMHFRCLSACGRRAPFVPTGGLSLCDPDALTFEHYRRLERRDSTQHGNHELASRGCRVDAHRQDTDSYTLAIQLLDDAQKLDRVARKAVRARDDKFVTLSDEVQRSGQLVSLAAEA